MAQGGTDGGFIALRYHRNAQSEANRLFDVCMEGRGWQGDEGVPGGSVASAQPAPDASQPSPPSGGISGTYAGEIAATIEGRAISMRITFTIVQNGDDIAGAWSTTAGASGAIAGTASEAAITAFRAMQLNPCPGSFLGSATIENKGMGLRGSSVAPSAPAAVLQKARQEHA